MHIGRDGARMMCDNGEAAQASEANAMNRQTTAPLPGTTIDPRYPDSNGRFMGDTEFHNLAMIWLREALEDYFADAPDVYVASNLVVYFTKRDPQIRKDPDVLVARKASGKHPRRSFRVWEEKTKPCTLFEIASKRTWRNDVGEKRELYARQAVKEYFIFDPEGLYLDPPLQGFRSVKRRSVPLEPVSGGLVSRQLGLHLVAEGTMLRLSNHRTGQLLLTRAERADQEKQRADQEQLRAEQEAIRADLMQQRADLMQQRADLMQQRADFEQQRANQLEADLQRLQAEVERLRSSQG
jgi:Uma2 family endonuclease